MAYYYRRFDQQQGPITWEALLGLASGGGIYPTDLVWGEGWPEWKEARLVPGLYAVPPPLPAAPRPMAQPGYGPAPIAGMPPPSAYGYPAGGYASGLGPGEDPMLRAVLPVGRAPRAIIAGYLGLFAILGIFAPFALILGILALRDLREKPGTLGKGRAIFAIVMGSLFTLLYAAAFIAAALGA